MSPNSFYKAWRYGVKTLFWRPVIKIKTKNHSIVLRHLKDMETGEIRRYDVIIDSNLGPDAETLDELIQLLKEDPYLNWIGFTLEKHIRLRRLMKR